MELRIQGCELGIGNSDWELLWIMNYELELGIGIGIVGFHCMDFHRLGYCHSMDFHQWEIIIARIFIVGEIAIAWIFVVGDIVIARIFINGILSLHGFSFPWAVPRAEMRCAFSAFVSCVSHSSNSF